MWSNVKIRRNSAWEEWYKTNQRRSGAWVQAPTKVNQYRNGAWRSLANLTPDTTTKSTTWTSNWEASYKSNGDRRTDVSGIGYQGYFSGTSNGEQTAMFGFNDQDMRSKMAGASIVDVDITFVSSHSWYNDGAVFVFGTHNQDNMPGSYSQVSTNLARSAQESPGTHTMNNVSRTFATQLRDGTARGIVLNANSTSLLYYGAVTSVAIKITYTN